MLGYTCPANRLYAALEGVSRECQAYGNGEELENPWAVFPSLHADSGIR